MDERERRRMQRMEQRRKELRRTYMIIGGFVLAVILAGAAIIIVPRRLSTKSTKKQTAADIENTVVQKELEAEIEGSMQENKDPEDAETMEESVQPESETELFIKESLSAQADRLAAMYDYDRAIELLKDSTDFATNERLQQLAQDYQNRKDACVAVSPDTVQHVFVHSLIADPSRAFDGESNQDGYNKNMVTLEEFKKIIQSMYNNGYVLVSPHDMGEIDANGQMQRKNIYLPEGKTPVIFSQDDVSYYHSYDNDGFADKLLIDENGKVKNQYTDAGGTVLIGDYDMVPVIDTFVEEHPDFSYRGMKGIVVLTGYDGVLGYHTDADYRNQTNLQQDQRAWLDAHPEFDIDADIAEATRVANAMKENGWEFASHTWGHIAVADVSLETLQTDTQKWLDNVAPIVGNTDMIIFAFGSDINDWTEYTSDNAKFNYLKSVGFDYFCNVDGSKLSWVQFGTTYLRTGRMNIDGYRMSVDPQILSPLFDVNQVYDITRPPMPAW